MSLTILNNISSLTAENALSNTQMNLQKTLTQLSTGLKINSGSDDAAGLSIADGMQANIAALTQSQQNAANGIGMLQTADGALSQVTSLLNRAVTLATEAANGTLNTTGSQATALDTEFQNILSNINTIGSTTNFNGQQVFTGTAVSIAMSDGTGSGNMTISKTIGALTSNSLGLGNSASYATATLSGFSNPTAGDTVTVGGTTYTFRSQATVTADNGTVANEVTIGANVAATLKNLADAVNGVTGSGTEYTNTTNVNTNVSATALTGTSVTFQAKTTAYTGAGAPVSASITGTTMGWDNGATTLTGGSAAGNDLLTTGHASTVLSLLTTAISLVAAQRGTVGAAINQLQADNNIMNTQVQNLSSAENSVMNADIGKTVANMTQYNVLQSTGMAALQQSNQAQQAVLKLVQ